MATPAPPAPPAPPGGPGPATIVKQALKEAVGGDFAVSGTAPGGRFEINGPPRSFGTSGTVTLNGKQLETVEWGSDYIVGKLPADAESGRVVVNIDSETKKTGHLEL